MRQSNYLYFDPNLQYPKDPVCSPSEPYPEYPWPVDTISNEPNFVYAAIREMFIELGLDAEHTGTPDWNPLGEYISPGQTVVIKPNFVMHKNGSSQPDDMESLVTHPSIIRCILDYCIIALHGRGALIVGDAPVKDCNFKLLMENGGYQAVKNFFDSQDCSVRPRFVDFRGPEEEGGQYEQSGHGVLVDLGRESYFYNCNHNWRKYRIPNYDYRKVRRHHCGERQEYLINSNILNADVIISLPKPKTHRKNGYTGALKNFVGINYSKEYLPHHTKGAFDNGGDEYKVKTYEKALSSSLRAGIDILRTKADAHHRKASFCSPRSICQKYHSRIENHCHSMINDLWSRYDRVLQKEKIRMDAINAPKDLRMIEGSWHGNDTIWRTVLDLNIIAEFADRCGTLQSTPQRKLLFLGDLIVAGDNEGPLAPSPKATHSLLFSEKASTFDCILVKFMGFDWEKFVGLKRAVSSSYLGDVPYSEIEISSNQKFFQGPLNTIDFRSHIDPFTAADGWKGYVEL